MKDEDRPRMRWTRSGKGRTRRPATLFGQYLKAAVLRQSHIREPLYDRLVGTDWHDAPPVAAAAFDLVVKRAYKPENNPPSVAEMVEGMRRFFHADGIEKIPSLESELLVRAALGERVPVDDIAPDVAFIVHSLIFQGLALDLSFGEAELNHVLAEAEEVAKSRGFNPTPSG